MTKETFIIKAKEVHGDKYDYSLVDYKNNKTKVKIICNTHNIFEMRPDAHLQWSECDCCRKEYGLKFLENAKIKHGDIYDYSLVNYINYYTKVKIVCIEHDVFEQTPGNHLRGFGCPLCFKSRGENLLFGLFKKYNIEFETQKTFNGCKNIRCLLFDFYLPMYNICIEFDGRQHFESIEYWGGDEKLIYTKNNDKIKTKYCLENNIILIRIKYDITFKNMEEIVENIIKNK